MQEGTENHPSSDRPGGELDQLVAEVTCGECWASPRALCNGGRGMHLARWERAARRGLIPQTALQAAVRSAGPVPDDASHAAAIVPPGIAW